MKVVIVGGVAGGMTAATRLRRLDESARIIVFDRGPCVSYANCGMPYHIGQMIKDRNALFVATPESLHTDYALDVRVQQEVTAIDRTKKIVTVRKLAGGDTYEESYGKLILSPGARPLVPKLPGVDLPGVFTLRSVQDMDAIKAPVDSGKVHTAVVVGGGFIGLEMVENLMARGLSVTVVEMLDQVLTPLDFEMAALVHAHLRLNNVRLALGDGLKSIAQDMQGRLAITLASGRVASADLVILAVGVQPESDLARAAGLETGPRGHIVVNEQMQTSDPDIYAVGDAVLVSDPISGQPTAIPLAGPANRQGRLAADHIAGRQVAYLGTQGTSITKVFDLAVGTTGLNAKQLKQLGIAFRSSISHSADHASYYPGSTQMSIKLLYDPQSGRLLGAQVVGVNGVPRSVNVLATAVRAGMSVFDLENLELAYAPPFGSAKDPVNVAGFVASNWLRGDVELISWDDVARLGASEDAILDVRTRAEWDGGHIEGAVHIPIQELRARVHELSKGKRWVVYCQIGRRGYIAARILRAHGLRAVNLSGGLDTLGAATERQGNFE
jgi:NADPH-dependent 2,4-dienoyl-CoA reductase/sulfur reductase-like enzyme/rhodanese-related sulfurtransferase